MADPAPILYLVPSVDPGGPDHGTADWFRHIDRKRWAPSLILTEPSPNRGLHEVESLAGEIWDLPDLMSGSNFPEFILGFIESRSVRLVHIADSRLAFDLLPDMACLRRPPAIVAQLHQGGPDRADYVSYATRRYGNLIDAFSVVDAQLRDAVIGCEIPPSRIEEIPDGPQTGHGHGELYERLLAARPASSRARGEDLFRGESAPPGEAGGEAPRPIVLPRTPPPERTVGVIVPCYRHGIFLDACIDSIKAQTLAPASVVVVDDGSDDPETIEALARLDDDPEIAVVRLPTNGGPSIARNRGLAELDTSYVLSIDADDELLPDALERMLAQLEAAAENVGFVYPHAQHIGNRSDYVQLPAYNLWLLMKENYCPAPALFDRRLFEGTGVAYPEDIVVGHEDWDLILQLAERDVLGIHADGPTFLYRKQGFSRVNAVDYGPHAFHEAIERRHPGLYGNADDIKARWSPALSIVLLDGAEGAWGDHELSGLPRQTCRDFEIVAGEELSAALDTARGRWVCVLWVGAAEMLRDSSFVEKLLYSFMADERDFAIVFGDRPDLSRPTFSRLDDSERLAAVPVGAAFERSPGVRFPKFTLSNPASPLADLAIGLQANGPVQWRLAAPASNGGVGEDGVAESVVLDLSHLPAGDKSQIAMRYMSFSQTPRLPELTPGTVRRWKDLEGWMPSSTQPLCRHVDFNDIGRIVSNERKSPPGYRLEFDLGALQISAAPGTRRLVYADNSFELSDDQDELGKGRHGLGYLEQRALPMLVPLELRKMPGADRHVLVAGRNDPLFEATEPVAELGWIEAQPILPRPEPLSSGPWGVDSLRRHADQRAWRHVYEPGDPGEESDSVVLGSLYRRPDGGLVPLRLREDGRLVTDATCPGRASRDPRKIGRWVAGSDGSNGQLSSPSAIETRLRHLAVNFSTRKHAGGAEVTLGWLREEDAPGCTALFSTTHPVTGDQLVTRFAQAAMDRGYLVDGVLGYILVAGAEDEAGEELWMAPWVAPATAGRR